ncbi:neutral/alkaline non-lysosomal ceramidase N-terminal domain-containing protein [Persicitalea jodogahamensis]|uniref:Alkaline ceramidase n=1 Tax=Persicitalea jodogahamensis TaxID=402147 RepID=A0A8J3GAH2_9BACT|nr:neutral/alkaline non-lysosomal ceramidase N-terminal domain-containing protein [Persicitalea jodogahamensis]GHB74830.1 alkaline ceramidase [Persicitalea jodogahamensis]
MRLEGKFPLLGIGLLLWLMSHSPLCFGQSYPPTWKAGVARTIITPRESMWMAGFAARDRPSDGVLNELWAKALVLEDAQGQRAVLISTDLLGLPKTISDHIKESLQKKFGLTKAQVLLNSSHTHSGPVLEDALTDIYPLDDTQRAKITRYSRWLETQLVALVGQAIGNLDTASLSSANGVTRFQVNRRNNDANLLTQLTELKGPNDYAVPVIRVVDSKQNIKAIAFGYACHPTVLTGNDWSGDYVSFAQEELEKTYPNATALFFQGAGADQNPLPRRTIPLARQYGLELSAAVKRVVEEELMPLEPKLTAVYKEIDLTLADAPTDEKLNEMANSSVPYYQRWAKRMLAKKEKGEPFAKSSPYPIQVLRLGDQPIVALGGELLIEYAIKIKQMFGEQTFVFGYSNFVMGYIPSATVLREGGYEGETSQMVYGQPAPWHSSIETNILSSVQKVAERAGLVKKN